MKKARISSLAVATPEFSTIVSTKALLRYPGLFLLSLITILSSACSRLFSSVLLLPYHPLRYFLPNIENLIKHDLIPLFALYLR